MRTTVEIKPQQRADLLKLAAQRGDKGFSNLVQEALDLYLRQHREKRDAVARALKLQGSFSASEGVAMNRSIQQLREKWR